MGRLSYNSVSEMRMEVSKSIFKREVEAVTNLGINMKQVKFLQSLFFNDVPLFYENLGVDTSSITSKVKNITENEVTRLYSLGYLDGLWTKSKTNPFPDMVNLTNKGKELIAEMLDINLEIVDKALKEEKDKVEQRFQTIERMFNDLYRIYPDAIGEGHGSMPLKACNAVVYNKVQYQGRDGIGELYCILIDFDEAKHQEILAKVQTDIEKGMIHTKKSLSKFVLDRTWDIMTSDTYFDYS